MNFPNPFRWAGKNIRTFHLGNSRAVASCKKHLQYQMADRESVSTGARRKASCVLRKCHIWRAFSRRELPELALRFFMQPSVPSRFVPDYRFPLTAGSFVRLCTLTRTQHARLCSLLPFARRVSRPNVLWTLSPYDRQEQSASLSFLPLRPPSRRQVEMQSREHPSQKLL